MIWKEKGNAIIKQAKEGRGIFLFGCANELEVGKKYDLLVRAVKEYQGLKELTHVYVLEDKGKEEISKYILGASDLSKQISHRQNEVIKDIVGVVKNKYFYAEGRKIPIFFKKKISTPPDGSELKIHYALLGYYKKLQLVVYSTKDFTILEK